MIAPLDRQDALDDAVRLFTVGDQLESLARSAIEARRIARLVRQGIDRHLRRASLCSRGVA